MMELEDVTKHSHGERVEKYLKLLCGEHSGLRPALYPRAREMATAEMLDEIHTMLRHLTKDKWHKVEFE